MFQFVADEERGGALGTRALLESGLIQGDACLVPEPTSLAVCVAERGLLQGEIVIKGRPAHGSRPREGVSAVEIGAQIALALHAADFGGPDHPLLGQPDGQCRHLSGRQRLQRRGRASPPRLRPPAASRDEPRRGCRRVAPAH